VSTRIIRPRALEEIRTLSFFLHAFEKTGLLLFRRDLLPPGAAVVGRSLRAGVLILLLALPLVAAVVGCPWCRGHDRFLCCRQRGAIASLPPQRTTYVKVQVCAAVVTAPAVTTVTGQGPAEVFLVTDAAVSEVGLT